MRHSDRLRIGALARRLSDVTAHQRAHTPPQWHVPQVQRLPKRLRHPGEAPDLQIRLTDVADLEQRYQAQPPTQQLQVLVTRGPAEPDDLRRLVESHFAPLRSGDAVAVRCQRMTQGGFVAHLTGHRDRLVTERAAAGLGIQKGQRDREPGQHLCPKPGWRGPERGQGLL